MWIIHGSGTMKIRELIIGIILCTGLIFNSGHLVSSIGNHEKIVLMKQVILHLTMKQVILHRMMKQVILHLTLMPMEMNQDIRTIHYTDLLRYCMETTLWSLLSMM